MFAASSKVEKLKCIAIIVKLHKESNVVVHESPLQLISAVTLLCKIKCSLSFTTHQNGKKCTKTDKAC